MSLEEIDDLKAQIAEKKAESETLEGELAVLEDALDEEVSELLDEIEEEEDESDEEEEDEED